MLCLGPKLAPFPITPQTHFISPLSKNNICIESSKTSLSPKCRKEARVLEFLTSFSYFLHQITTRYMGLIYGDLPSTKLMFPNEYYWISLKCIKSWVSWCIPSYMKYTNTMSWFMMIIMLKFLFYLTSVLLRTWWVVWNAFLNYHNLSHLCTLLSKFMISSIRAWNHDVLN